MSTGEMESQGKVNVPVYVKRPKRMTVLSLNDFSLLFADMNGFSRSPGMLLQPQGIHRVVWEICKYLADDG